MVVSITALLATLAVPGMIDLTRDVRRDSAVGDIVASLGYARAEAIKRGQQVTLCPSGDGVRCRMDRRWESGWIVFVDADGDGTPDPGGAVLHRVSGIDGATLRSGRPRLAYRASGFSEGFNDTLSICDGRDEALARSVVIANTGRVRIRAGADACP